jgi:hypothetical protein
MVLVFLFRVSPRRRGKQLAILLRLLEQQVGKKDGASSVLLADGACQWQRSTKTRPRAIHSHPMITKFNLAADMFSGIRIVDAISWFFLWLVRTCVETLCRSHSRVSLIRRGQGRGHVVQCGDGETPAVKQ